VATGRRLRRLLGGPQATLEAAPPQPGAGRGSVAERSPPADAATARGAVYVNAFRPLEPSFSSTALRTHPLRYDALRDERTRPAEEFLVNSRLRRGDVEFEASVAAYFTQPAADVPPLVGHEGRRGVAQVALPPSVPLRLAFDETVARRRSGRTYTGDPMTLAYLATILRVAYGITGRAGDLALRATPSGGGLYPVDVHVAALRVDSLLRATYVFDPLEEALWQTGGEATVDALLGSVAAPDEVVMTSSATALVLLVARPWRGMRKYGARGMRHVFLEAGAIAEHVNLAAAALGIGSVDSSSFYDDEVHEALGFDGVFEALVHAQVLGVPD